MRKNGMGRSNALPIGQAVLGAALLVLALIAASLGRSWIEWVVAASGATQVVVGLVTYRKNQRLDREEDEAPRSVAADERRA